MTHHNIPHLNKSWPRHTQIKGGEAWLSCLSSMLKFVVHFRNMLDEFDQSQHNGPANQSEYSNLFEGGAS